MGHAAYAPAPLSGRPCAPALLGMPGRTEPNLTPDHVPRFADVTARLKQTTGWELVPCDGLVHEDVFFDLLVHRRFPVTWWLRKPEQLDYLPEPDLFHDLFGHVPLLGDPDFSAYMQAYGAAGQRAKALGKKPLRQLTRLYWWTVEFGLIQEHAKPGAFDLRRRDRVLASRITHGGPAAG